MGGGNDFIEHLRELLAPVGAFGARRMFGGWGIYLDGRMIGLVADAQLYLKVDEDTRPQFAAAGCAPFVYTSRKGQIQMSYWSTPEAALESAEAMAPWAGLALAAALRKAAAPKRRGAHRAGRARRS